MATKKWLRGICEFGGPLEIVDAVGTSWDGGCEHFKNKASVLDHYPKVCGNCEHFTVWGFESYPDETAVSMGASAETRVH